MIKRIAAMLLAAVMFFHIGGEACRVKAVAPAVATVVPGVAQVLYGIMTGRAEEVSEALLDAGVDIYEAELDVISVKTQALINNGEAWLQGWNMIFKTVSGWFDDGTIELDEEGKAYITYYNYLELCNSMYEYVDLNLDLGSPMEHGLLNASFNSAILCSKMPTLDSFFIRNSRASYVPIYFSAERMYFTLYSFTGFDWTDSGFTSHIGLCLPNMSFATGAFGGVPLSNLCDLYSPLFYYSSQNNMLNFQYIDSYGNVKLSNVLCDIWYCFDFSTGTMKSCDFSDVDTTLSQGYLMCEDNITNFKDTITTITTTPDTSQVDDLSGTLDDLLVLNPNPGLVIDPNPAIPIPSDAVTITDIPLVDDMTLTDVMADTMPIGLDMQLPKIIFNKFPFSLPFDLYRLLTIFVAEPVTPVFRIPISNVNVDMSAFKDNEMLGEYSYSETFEPMFEIDEEIVIDFSGLPFIQAISYTCFIVGFIAFLILITTKLIHH